MNEYARVWRDPWHFLAFGCGLGTFPVAPGTWGSLLGVIFYLLLQGFSWWVYIILTVMASVFGVWLCEKVSKDLGVHDHRGIVWDEVVGMMLTLLFVPPSLFNLVVGFLLFRLFDIWKPWPISVVDEKVKGGLGIMLDDILAAVPAWALLWAIIYLIRIVSS